MYQVLYRKWRPKTFSDVVGQPHVTASLSGAVKSGRLSHAYLFTGSRGTGKTSCAKILAKAVNCEHPVDGNPCNACDTCRGIDNGSILDVIEIDAASNNGVDNIRDLREEANYTPTAAKYRVYIIDEVHMLSTGAFNALLKTLEEPPEHVKFILATTEVHKLPSTILSRCQRFDFKRIEPQDIAARLLYVANEEGIALTEDGAMLIARIADGAMRDALSLLDRCAAYGAEITEGVVSDAAGLAGREYLFALTEAVAERDSAKTLTLLNDLYNNACNMERLLADLLSHFRNMMLARSVPNYKDLIVCPQAELEKIAVQAKNFTLARILSAMDILNETAVRLKAGANGRTAVEMALLRLADPQLDTDVAALSARVAEVERRLDTGAFQTTVKSNTITEDAKKSTPQAAPAPEKPTPQAAQKTTQPETGAPLPSAKSADKPETAQKTPTAPPAETEFSKWAEALERLATIDRPLVPHMKDSSAVVRGDLLLIKSDNPMLERFLQTGSHANCIVRAVYDVTGVKYKLGIFNSNQAAPNGGTQPEPPKKDLLADLLSRAETLGVQIIEQ